MTTINRYIERCLIDEYAYKHRSGYSLSVSDLPDSEIQNFLEFLFKNDPATKEMITDRMQELIEQRLPFAESQDKYDQGYIPIHDHINGEVSWIARRGAA